VTLQVTIDAAIKPVTRSHSRIDKRLSACRPAKRDNQPSRNTIGFAVELAHARNDLAANLASSE
jgi:hypothetical protein